jgi:hypothetical protein
MALQSPFFIVGCGRSGTTLLRTMLNHHSQIAIPLESLFIVDYLRARGKVTPQTFRRLIATEYELAEWDMPFTLTDFAGCISAQDFIDRAHELYVQQAGKRVWGQKTPRFVRHGALLKRHYPQAKFINILRDPRAVVSSLIRSNVHNSNALYAARRWQRDVNAGLQLGRAFPGDVLHVHYEDLVRDTEATLRAVCEFLAIDFEPALLDYHKTGTQEYSGYYAQIHAKLNQAPDTSRIDAWRKHLSPQDVAVVESICGPLMDDLGYAREATEPVHEGTLDRLQWERKLGFVRQVWHNYTTRRGYLMSFLRRKLALGLLFGTVKELNY